MTRTSRTLACLGAAAIAAAMFAHLSARSEASVPVLLRIVPAAPLPSNGPQTLAVDGREFQPGPAVTLTTPGGGTVHLKETDIQGLSDTYFRATVLLDREGGYALTLTNRDGGISRPFSFEVKRGSKMASPAIEDVTPRDLRKDPSAQDLHVTGRAFAAGMRVRLTNPLGEDVADVTTSKISDTSFDLKAVLGLAGDYELAVVTTGGAVSNVWRLSVQ